MDSATGMLRGGARMFAAQTAATTVKLHLTLRKAYSFGSMVMSLLGFDSPVATFAYPGATRGAMSAAALSAAPHAGKIWPPNCATPNCRRHSTPPCSASCAAARPPPSR